LITIGIDIDYKVNITVVVEGQNIDVIVIDNVKI